jgi:hypothetical protein
MTARTTEPELKLFSRMVMNGECWDWTGSLDGKKYGMIRVCGVIKKTHRLSYEIFKGPIPAGLLVMHSCDNPKCFNPDHLLVGTNQDNVDDKMRKRRHRAFSQTHCKHGHEFTPDNFYVRKSDNSRQCRECYRIRCRAHYWKRGKLCGKLKTNQS